MSGEPARPRGGHRSTVVSLMALVVATVSMGGAAYAGLVVRSADIVDGTIRSVDVRDNTLTAADIQEGTLGYPTKLRPGQTIRGVIGARDNVGASTGSIVAMATVPARHSRLLSDINVVVAGGSDSGQANCDGSWADPTAPMGVVCIYPISTVGATNIRGLSVLDPPFGSLWGFRMAWEPTGPNQLSGVEAVWAFTAS